MSRDRLPQWRSIPESNPFATQLCSRWTNLNRLTTVTGWYQKTPPDFIFAAKVPQIVTHEKVLKDCEVEFDEFVDTMDLLDEKLGPLLLEFPWFSKYEMQPDESQGACASSSNG